MRILLCALAMLLSIAAPAAAAPNPSYRVAPDPPVVNRAASYESTSTSTTKKGVSVGIKRVEWDFADGGGFEQSGQRVEHTYASSGTKTFRMRVTDQLNAVKTESFKITVSGSPVPSNTPPVAQFRVSPTSPLLGQEVLFESLSYDPDGSVASSEWDFDGDGFDDGNAPRVAHDFGSAGVHVARLRVFDNFGTPSAVATQAFRVLPLPANRLPVAQFSVSDTTPGVGQRISLRSFSYDPDGAITAQRWDTDGDGAFDENVTGSAAYARFRRPGPRIVRLWVKDSSGASQTETVSLTVRRRSVLMYPFPVIRLAGSVVADGAQVRTLEVRAPRLSQIVVKCRGLTCPVERLATTSATRKVRFGRMARFFETGTVIAVRVRKRNLIGKYTRWVIRGGKLPERRDLCLYPARAKPARCPR